MSDRSRKRATTGVALAFLAGWTFTGLRAATLSKAEWQAGSSAGVESLVLQFAGGAPELVVDAQPWGLSIFLPGMKLGAIGTEGIRLLEEPGGSRMQVDRPGVEIRSVRFEGDSVRILLGARVAQDAGGQTYKLGAGDVITVTVYKNPDLTGDFTIAPDGTLNMPFVGTIPAKGLTDVALTERLREILAKDFLVDPQVSVTVKTYQSQWVYIAGSVGKASRVPLSPGMSFKDILSEAGVGLVPEQQLILTRAGGKGESLTIDADAIDRIGLPAPRDGDVLSIQEPAYFFVQGEVRRPGRLALSPALTVLQAISMAEGLTEWASKKDVRVRRTVNGETVEEVVNLKKIEDRKTPDIPIRPGDLILVKRKVL